MWDFLCLYSRAKHAVQKPRWWRSDGLLVSIRIFLRLGKAWASRCSVTLNQGCALCVLAALSSAVLSYLIQVGF